MSEEGDTFWISLAEKFFGVILIIIGAIMLYFTATSTNVLGGFSLFFGILSLIMLIIGLFLLLVRPPE
jgi:predicted ferric reductase